MSNGAYYKFAIPAALLLCGFAMIAILNQFLGLLPQFSTHLLLLGSAGTLPLVVLILLLRPTANQVPVGIWRQLQQLSSGSAEQFPQLNFVAGDSSTVTGWNQLVDFLQTRTALAELESRLSDLIDQQQDSSETEILNHLAEGIGVTDLEGRLTFINRALAAIMNVDRNELQNLTVEQLLPESLPDSTWETLQTDRPLIFDSEHKDDQAVTYLRWNRRPNIDELGKVSAHVWSIRDITQQKLAERSREDFVAMATHELRTPLSNINAYAETLMLTDEIDVEQQKAFYNIIRTEATRLSRFIDELLDVSRMEAGSLTIDKKETDLLRLLKEACEKVRPEMEHKQQEFEISIPAKLPSIQIDKEAISAALVNLLGNACKYTPAGGKVSLAVKCEETHIHFAISDTGIGIAAEEISRVFEKFFRSDDDRVREITGSGLGLAFTSEVARLHGGRIELTSELDQGSCFTFVLPITQQGNGSQKGNS